MRPKIVLDLPPGSNNPRNSEGSFVTLADGRVLFVYSRYYGESGSDHGAATLCARSSADGGRTWTTRDRVVVANEGRCNVMSVSLLRLQDGRIALFYARKNSWLDCRPRMRTSRDEGQTWSRPTLCVPAPGYFVLNNDRVIQLTGGRIVLPLAYHRAKFTGARMRWDAFDGRGIAMFFFSDDGGKTWQEGADWWALPVRCGSGLQEPGVIELLDGRLYAYCRTGTGRQWEMVSEDRGDTWSSPQPSRFRSPCSPLSMKRLPATGRLLAVWNDHAPSSRPAGRKYSQARTPLAVALSGNDGKTWCRPKLIETDPRRGFCYTAIHVVDDAVLLAYCCGGRGLGNLQRTCVRRVPLAWLSAR